MMSCGSSNSDPICNCYKMFVDEVKKQNLDYEGAGVSAKLKEIYTNLAKKDPEFLKCTDNTIFEGDLFSRSKLRIFSSMDTNCLDNDAFKKIIEKGPLIYKAY